jgi:thiol-disulfide isomerase/thioredoxin
MISIKKLIGSVVFFLLFAQVNGQDEVTLRIGDPAPAIKYSKWLKGEPVTSFNSDHLYILEFWATWCGPCKGAMPHLTKLQKEYEGKISIIGVGVWEKIKEGEAYESSLPMVAKYVQGNDANMGYSVIADNNDQHMGDNWLKAAGQGGIPSTFIIKNEKIIWIGHPMALDTTLPKIFDGSYDMDTYKNNIDKKTEAYKKRFAANVAALKPINDALAAKEYEKAFKLMEKLQREKPDLRSSLTHMRFDALLKQGREEEILRFGNQWQKESESGVYSILGKVIDEDKLSKAIFLWAARSFDSSVQDKRPLNYHMLASCYAKGGDYKNAIINEEKAIEGAKVALKKGEMVGTIMNYTVTEYEEALAGYKKASKADKN